MNEFEIYAENQKLELIFSKGHHLYGQIYYDYAEGKYYNRHTDFFLEERELPAFGLGASKSTVEAIADFMKHF